MSVIKITDVYLGDSVRGYSQAGLPTFGKFSAVTRQHMLAIFQTEDGYWSIALPWGSVASGEWSQEQATEAAQARVAAKVDGWTPNQSEAIATAIASAKERHNAKARESAGYAAKYGPEVA